MRIGNFQDKNVTLVTEDYHAKWKSQCENKIYLNKMQRILEFDIHMKRQFQKLVSILRVWDVTPYCLLMSRFNTSYQYYLSHRRGMKNLATFYELSVFTWAIAISSQVLQARRQKHSKIVFYPGRAQVWKTVSIET